MKSIMLLLALAAACAGDDAPPNDGPASTSSAGADTGAAPDEPAGVDSSDGPQELGCVDDYHGNQALAAAHGLTVDPVGTANPVSLALGDGLAANPAEIGGDQLAVCHAAPSDFFALETTCAGYVTIELRKLEGKVPGLVLYDDAGQALEELGSSWDGFFLKPLQRHVGAGTHVLEVRHAGGEAGRYSLTVLALPDSTCR